MDMKRLTRLGVASIALTASTMIAFQNCSKVSFQTPSEENFSSVTIRTIQPSLAARGISCVTCHSAISSNVVTDYGMGSPWYFDTASSDSFYFDRVGTPMTDPEGLATIRLLNNSKLIVPKGSVPQAIQSKFNVTTLAQFIQTRFMQVSPVLNQSSQVVEVASLKINLPTASRIEQVFGNPSGTQAYKPTSSSSPALSGLTYDSANNLYVINNLVCDGDLFLGSTVFFNNAKIQSVSGCRIYTTGNVFMDVPVISAAYNGSTDYNTQVLSSQGIWLGVGRLNNGSYCERDANNNPSGWYIAGAGVDCTTAAHAGDRACDTGYFRQASMLSRNTWATAYSTTSAIQTYFQQGGTVDQERARVEAHLGHPLYDAACTASKRATAISRLMLVAPYVNNRFNGDFSGSVVSEAPLMSLGSFIYQFDPIFAKVSVFTLLDEGELLSGQGI